MGNDATDEAPSLQKTCAGCGATPPKVDGEFALIRAGWRLTRPKDQTSRQAPEWWCRTCFERRRARASG
jgi:hypothetical protein